MDAGALRGGVRRRHACRRRYRTHLEADRAGFELAAHRAEIDDRVAHALVTVGRVPGEALPDDPFDLAAGIGQHAGPQLGEGRHRGIDDRVQRIDSRAPERPLAREHLVQEDAETGRGLRRFDGQFEGPPDKEGASVAGWRRDSRRGRAPSQ